LELESTRYVAPSISHKHFFGSISRFVLTLMLNNFNVNTTLSFELKLICFLFSKNKQSTHQSLQLLFTILIDYYSLHANLFINIFSVYCYLLYLTILHVYYLCVYG